jgi:hypothetical protein
MGRASAASRIGRVAVLAGMGVLLLAGSLTAQPRPFRGPGDGAGFFGIGWTNADVADLNARLTAVGYPDFGRTGLLIGGGGYRQLRGGLLLGGEGYGAGFGEEAHVGRTTRLGGGYGLFNVGYMLPTGPNLRLYPLVGIGGGGLVLSVSGRPTDAGFDDVLRQPDHGVALSRGSFLTSLGAGLEVRPGAGGRGPMVGVRVGYSFAPFSSAWRLEEQTIGAGPDSSLQGLQVRFLIGGGGGGRR